MKNMQAILLAASMLLTAAACASEPAVTVVKPDGDGTFADVSEAEWYAEDIKNSFSLGLMQGIGDNLFSPNGNVTVAEAITVAARAAASDSGKTISSAKGEWYAPYVSFAVENGLIGNDTFTDADFDRPAKRREVAMLFRNALPDDKYPVINEGITAIPDVSPRKDYYDDLLTLYKAGVVLGSDEYGNFRAEDAITRAEVSAIINRAVLPDHRITRTPRAISYDEAYLLTQTGSLSGGRTGCPTGWQCDNRGGVPLTTVNTTGTIANISDTDDMSLIREFNKVATGVITTDVSLRLSEPLDGFVIESKNENGEAVHSIGVKDGSLGFYAADGAFTPCIEVTAGSAELRFVIDLDGGTSALYWNTENVGTSSLLLDGEDRNIAAMYFTAKAGSEAVVLLNSVISTVNYAVYDRFSAKPIGWEFDNAERVSGELEISMLGSAMHSFAPISGTAVAETKVLIKKNTGFAMILSDSGRDIVTLHTKDGKLYADETEVYDLYDGLWYRMRLECDTFSQTTRVRLNGRVIAEVPFAVPTTTFDALTLDNTGTSTIRTDDIKVFRTNVDDLTDYVPEPVIPEGADDYYVGMNICSLWQEGTHGGWACITPYEDLVLGYYDEGIPETADWEIKYFVEHGVDFQAFCWYADQSNGYMKEPSLNYQLHDAFMNAKYSDKMKYCLIWECANAARPRGLDAFKKYYVPYFIENYFKDPRYMTIDNRLVFCMFSPGSLLKSDALATPENVRAAFDYMEEEVKKLGFDGIIYMGCNTSKADANKLGIDASYAYNWGTPGNTLSTNKGSNLSLASGNDETFYTVPTISVGFNSIGWHGKRYPMMTTEDFLAAQRWVKNEYLPVHADKGTWREKLVMISTWNEYGEGTYTMPGRCNGGFGYLDALRETYTDEIADESLNTVPSAEQLRRIDRMYPAYRKILRDTGYSEMKIESLDKYETVYEFDLTKSPSIYADGTRVKDFSVDSDGVHGTTTHNDFLFYLPSPTKKIDLSQIDAISIRMEIKSNNRVELFYVTEENGSWTQDKSLNFLSSTNEMTEYIVRLNKSWAGTLATLRVDPAASSGVSFTVQSVKLLTEKKTLESHAEMTVNGLDFTIDTAPAVYDGTMYVAYDIATALDYRLGAYTDWRWQTGTLNVSGNGHTVSFVVGSKTYTADGSEKTLPHEVYLEDGLPMIPIEAFCEALGYQCLITDTRIVIDTNLKDYFATMANIPEGSWEFNNVGFTEGWSSQLMTLSVGKEGYMTAFGRSSTDPTTYCTPGKPLIAADYDTLTVRCRWEMDTASSSNISMYFITNRDNAWNEDKALRASLPTRTSNGEFVELKINLKDYPGWSDQITNLRFDPFNATGTMDIDYIRFTSSKKEKESFMDSRDLS